jgi:hypothetical protein
MFSFIQQGLDQLSAYRRLRHELDIIELSPLLKRTYLEILYKLLTSDVNDEITAQIVHKKVLEYNFTVDFNSFNKVFKLFIIDDRARSLFQDLYLNKRTPNDIELQKIYRIIQSINDGLHSV